MKTAFLNMRYILLRHQIYSTTPTSEHPCSSLVCNSTNHANDLAFYWVNSRLHSKPIIMQQDRFVDRHIGPRQKDIDSMLATIGMASIEELIAKTIPASIRLKQDLDLPEAMTEAEFAAHIREVGAKNKLYRSYIGLGYYDCIVPNVVKRNVLENPGWYTAYTPYQAEIAQGRLEALLNFQTMICDLTGLEIANASLLDEATAASEAMIMLYNARSRAQQKAGVSKFFVSTDCFPQTIDLLVTRSRPLGIELVIGDHEEVHITEEFYGAMLQYPAKNGEVKSLAAFTEKVHAVGAFVAVAADIMSLVLLQSPGSWGADVVLGNSQRFGVPMGYGGPHAAFFACKDDFKRIIPGRIIGVSEDSPRPPCIAHGLADPRAAHQARQGHEQHLHRAGTVGHHGEHVCRVSWPCRTAQHRHQHPPQVERAGRQTEGAWLRTLQRALFRHDKSDPAIGRHRYGHPHQGRGTARELPLCGRTLRGHQH
jgi:glycine cleavage system pyridoxal-binding protein P